jgi:hypothetical protein
MWRGDWPGLGHHTQCPTPASRRIRKPLPIVRQHWDRTAEVAFSRGYAYTASGWPPLVPSSMRKRRRKNCSRCRTSGTLSCSLLQGRSRSANWGSRKTSTMSAIHTASSSSRPRSKWLSSVIGSRISMARLPSKPYPIRQPEGGGALDSPRLPAGEPDHRWRALV